jgi:hypothetical protein
VPGSLKGQRGVQDSFVRGTKDQLAASWAGIGRRCLVRSGGGSPSGGGGGSPNGVSWGSRRNVHCVRLLPSSAFLFALYCCFVDSEAAG